MIEIVTTQARRFDDFQSALEANDTDKILIHDGTGTKTITAANFKADLLATLDAMQTTINQLTFPGAGPHNSIFRGKNLGDHVTPEQWAAIADGSFTGLYIGDYWVIGGITWRIAAFSYFAIGLGAINVPHVLIVPDDPIASASMNATDTTAGGYYGSLMRTTNLTQAKTIVSAAFGSHVKSHQMLLSTAATINGAAGWAWVDSDVELMNEVAVYGSQASGRNDGHGAYNTGSLPGRFPLFVFRGDLAFSPGADAWLNSIVDDARFGNTSGSGAPGLTGASGIKGVRPFFAITA